MVVQTWWAYFTILHSPIWANLFAFLLPIVIFVLLYMICEAALPDLTKLDETATLDLRMFYFGQRRYFFTLWGVVLLLATLVERVVGEPFDLLGAGGFRIGGVAAAAVMATSRWRPLHVVVTVLSIGALSLCITLFTLTLS